MGGVAAISAAGRVRLRDGLYKAVVNAQELAGGQRSDVHRQTLENAGAIIGQDFYLAGTSMVGTRNSGIIG
jgi:hypothetical protein